MDEQLKKLKTKSIIVIILALLAFTWQFLSYLTIKDYFQAESISSMEAIIIYSSYVFLLILFIALLSLSFTIFRVSMIYRAKKKRDDKKNNPSAKTPPETKVQL